VSHAESQIGWATSSKSIAILLPLTPPSWLSLGKSLIPIAHLRRLPLISAPPYPHLSKESTATNRPLMCRAWWKVGDEERSAAILAASGRDHGQCQHRSHAEIAKTRRKASGKKSISLF